MGSLDDDDGNEKMVPCLVGGSHTTVYVYIYVYIVYIPGYLVYRSFRVFSGDGSIRVDGTITFELIIL